MRPLEAAKLAEAARLVREVLPRLDTRRSLCDSCGLTKHENRPEFQAAVELEAVARKLERFASNPNHFQEESSES